jgi:hypothetical protein
MSEWLKLDPRKLNPARREQIRGVEVEVFLSPYDVPDAVRGDFDDEVRRFVIEFKYPTGGETLVSSDDDRHVRLFTGRHSGRVYRIEVDVEALEAKAVGLRVHGPKLIEEVDEAIDRAVRKPDHKVRPVNYAIVRDIIAERSGELFESLVPK